MQGLSRCTSASPGALATAPDARANVPPPPKKKLQPKICRRALRGYQRRQWEATTVQPFPSVEHEDAFLRFRALCKLSQRPDHAGSGDGLAVAPTAEEARQMESKAVSLVSGCTAAVRANLFPPGV